jgi:protein TonB
MEKHLIPHADLLDIIFDGRNKEYGAYEIRKTYNNRLGKALLFTAAVCMILIVCYRYFGKAGSFKHPYLLTGGDVFIPEPYVNEKPLKLPLPKTPLSQPQKIETIRNIIPKIVKEPPPEDRPPENSELDKAAIGNTTIKGVDPGDAPASLGPDNKGVVSVPQQNQKEESTEIFKKVEIESSYPGGDELWKKFLLRNFHIPGNTDITELKVAVLVEFLVDEQGIVSRVTAISGPAEFREEAIRVIKKSGKWNPAIQNGRPVKSYKNQPILIQIQPE